MPGSKNMDKRKQTPWNNDLSLVHINLCSLVIDNEILDHI